MGSRVEHLAAKALITPPKWLKGGAIVYETIMGSVSYGASDETSDLDVYGVAVPPKTMVFPHLDGHIDGFGPQRPVFHTYQEHHIFDRDAHGGKGQEYDLNIFGIVKFFSLAAECNPNVIDSLYTERAFVLHSTAVGEMLREHRDLFLHRGAWPKFRGYGYSQLHKAATKSPEPGSKRAADVQRYGFDRKFVMHVLRLLGEAEQILTTGTLDLMRDKELLKAARRGEIDVEAATDIFTEREQQLQKAFAETKLRAKPDWVALKQLLLDCLEHHYGSIADAFVEPGAERRALSEIAEICARLV